MAAWMTPRVLFVFGTRPEAIKLCPLIRRFRHSRVFEPVVCTTGQHRELLSDALGVFEVEPDFDLAVMQPGQSLIGCASRILSGLESVLQQVRPDWVIVQGDTTSTLCGAMAGFYSFTPVAHLEAGLRTGDLRSPFPEEMHRVVTTRLAAAHFAATPSAAEALRAEGVSPQRIQVTGNTGIDALLDVKARLESAEITPRRWPWLDPGRKLVVATAHRRESFGQGFDAISQGLRRLSQRPDVQIACLLHPNPSAREALAEALADSRAVLLDPLDYASFVDLMRRAHFLVSDSGGIQEEAPALGTPVLVLRDVTERTEAVDAGAAQLVGSSPDRLMEAAGLLLDSPSERQRRSRVRLLYGDGNACLRVEDGLLRIGGRRTLAAAM